MPPLRAFISSRAVRSRGHWTWVSIMFVLVSSNGRLLSTPQAVQAREELLKARDQVSHFAKERTTQLQQLVRRIRKRGDQEAAARTVVRYELT